MVEKKDPSYTTDGYVNWYNLQYGTQNEVLENFKNRVTI